MRISFARIYRLYERGGHSDRWRSWNGLLFVALQSQIDEIETLTMFCESLENRARTMSNDMIKIDCMVSDMLKLRPDTDRIARAENFIEDGKLDVRRD